MGVGKLQVGLSLGSDRPLYPMACLCINGVRERQGRREKGLKGRKGKRKRVRTCSHVLKPSRVINRR